MTRLRFLHCFSLAAHAAVTLIANERAAEAAAYMFDSLHEVVRPYKPNLLGTRFMQIFAMLIDDCLMRYNAARRATA